MEERRAYTCLVGCSAGSRYGNYFCLMGSRKDLRPSRETGWRPWFPRWRLLCAAWCCCRTFRRVLPGRSRVWSVKCDYCGKRDQSTGSELLPRRNGGLPAPSAGRFSRKNPTTNTGAPEKRTGESERQPQHQSRNRLLVLVSLLAIAALCRLCCCRTSDY